MLTKQGDSRSTHNAIRRAAKQLEASGQIEVSSIYVDGKPRLAAFIPDGRAPESKITMGLDGKECRLPTHQPAHTAGSGA